MGRGQGEHAREKVAGQGHSPLLVLVGQEEVLHLLPPEVQLVVIIALYSLSLIHRVIQRQQELFESFHHGRWHTQIDLRNAAQPGGQQGILDGGKGVGAPR